MRVREESEKAEENEIDSWQYGRNWCCDSKSRTEPSVLSLLFPFLLVTFYNDFAIFSSLSL